MSTPVVKKLVPLTTEDWNIILRLGQIARIATVRETGHIDRDYESMMWREHERSRA